MNNLPCGGDAAGCLSSTDIDEVIGDYTLLPADTFWRLGRGETTHEYVNRKLRGVDWAITVFHCRHHWLLFEVTNSPTTCTIRVFDSAPSEAVRQDVIKLAKRLDLPTPEFAECPQQFRGTNECGLFTILNALILSRTQIGIPAHRQRVSLAPLRAPFPDAGLMLYAGLEAYGIATAPSPQGGTPEAPHQNQRTAGNELHAETNPATTAPAPAQLQDGQGDDPAPQQTREDETALPLRCTAQKQQKRGGQQCTHEAATTHTALCKFHLMHAHIGASTCTAKSTATKKRCTQKAVDGLTVCPFHAKDEEFTEWLAQFECKRRTEENQQQLQPQQPATEPEPPIVTALEALGDPDEENALLERMEDIPPWGHSGNQYHSTTPPLSASAKLRDLKTYLMQPCSEGHPLAQLAWNRSTLLGHARALRMLTDAALPQPILNAPLVPAILEVISMKRKRASWRWTTTLRTMAEVAGALRNLPISKGLPAITLSNDAQWVAAIKGVAGRAKTERPRVPRAATLDEVTKAIAAEPQLNTRRLLALTWCFCGRTGDVRKLTHEDVVWIPDNTLGPNPIKVCFRQGKTIARRGPYSLTTLIPAHWMQYLGDIRSTTDWVKDLKKAAVPDILTALRRIHPSLENRSLRRGALQSLAQLPDMTDDILLSFSGHTNVCTLRRYLNWGTIDRPKELAMAKAAASSIAAEAIGGRPLTEQPPPPYRPPPSYTDHVASCNDEKAHGGSSKPATISLPYRRPTPPRNAEATSGKTHERWLAFLGAEAPPTAELPATQHHQRDASQLPMMAKEVSGNIDYRKVLDKISNPHLRDLAQSACRWLHDPTIYHDLLNNSRRSARRKASCTLQDTDFEIMIKLKKYEDNPIEGEIEAWCRTFTVPEWSKNPPRRRHIAEPLLNDKFEETPTICYPTRQNRHNTIMAFAKGFAITLDLASFFDQIPLSQTVRRYFGITTSSGRLSRMKVLPMGFRPSAQVAQCISWAIVERAACTNNVKIITYLDNILVLAATAPLCRKAREMIISDASSVGAVFNPEGLHDEPTQQFDFLGERFDISSDIVTSKASEKTVAKLNMIDIDAIFPEHSQSNVILTKRQLAAVVGLCLFADGSGLDNNDIYERFHALRYYSEQVSQSTHLVDWDGQCSPPSPLARRAMRTWLICLRLNRPRPILRDAPERPQIIMFVDASDARWSYVLWNREDSTVRTHASQWSAEDHERWNLASSVSSEPLGACRSLCHAIPPGSLRTRRVDLYTDHAPLVTSVASVCARTFTYWRLQKLLKDFRAAGTIVRVRHIPGRINPADPGSRGIVPSPEAWQTLLGEAQAHADDGEYGDRAAESDPEWGPTARNRTRLLHFVHEHPA